MINLPKSLINELDVLVSKTSTSRAKVIETLLDFCIKNRKIIDKVFPLGEKKEWEEAEGEEEREEAEKKGEEVELDKMEEAEENNEEGEEVEEKVEEWEDEREL